MPCRYGLFVAGVAYEAPANVRESASLRGHFTRHPVSIGTAGGRQAPAPLAAIMGTTAAWPLSSGTRPRAIDNGWFYVNNSKTN